MFYSVYKQEGIYFSDFVYTQQTTTFKDAMCPQIASQWFVTSGCYTLGAEVIQSSPWPSLSCASQSDEFSAMHFLVMYHDFDLKIIKKNKLQNTLKVFPLSLCFARFLYK